MIDYYAIFTVVNLAVLAALCGMLPVALRKDRAIRADIQNHAANVLEVVEHVRLAMEDLRSRDPQLEEMLAVALLELAETERVIKAQAAGDWATVRRIRRER